jgi:hypothetical protein
MSNNSMGAGSLTAIGHMQPPIRLNSTRQRNVQESSSRGMAEELTRSKSWEVVTTALGDAFGASGGSDPCEWCFEI